MLGDSIPPEGNALISSLVENQLNNLQELDENQLKNLAIRNIHDRLDENQLKKSQRALDENQLKKSQSSFHTALHQI